MNNFDFKKVVLDLIQKNGQTTSLEVKNTLRTIYPLKKFYQTDISNDLAELADDGEISVIGDNGTYRTYGLASTIENVTKTEMAQLLEDNEGEEVTIEYTNKKKETTIKEVTLWGMNVLGYRNIEEITSNGIIQKQIDPKQVKKLIVGNKTYIVKKS